MNEIHNTQAALVLPEYEHEYRSSPPPDYKPTPAATERVIAIALASDIASASAVYHDRSSHSHSPARPTTVHSNTDILVILPRSGHSSSRPTSRSLPAYGRQATISGLLSLAPGRWTSTISKVAVSLKGQASSVLIQQATREPASSRRLFFISQVLWSNTPENDRNSLDKSIKFEFQFPESIAGGQAGVVDLPPTFDEETQMTFGIAIHVKIEYSLRVDVWRRGLWSHKR